MSKSEQRDEGGILPWPKDEKDPQPGELDPQQYLAAVKADELFVGMANRKEKPAQRESELSARCRIPGSSILRRRRSRCIGGGQMGTSRCSRRSGGSGCGRSRSRPWS